MLIIRIVLLFIFLNSSLSFTQEKEHAQGYLISKLSWLSGYWITENDAGTHEEIWSNPLGRNMTGTYRIMNSQGELIFSEFAAIIEKDASLFLTIKMFKGDLTPMADKEFKMTRIGDNEVQFDRLLYQMLPDGKLKITIMPDPDQQEDREQVFIFTKNKFIE